MTDVVPELLEKTKNDINKAINKSSKALDLLKRLEEGKADYTHANEYALEIAKILSKAIGQNVNVEVLPDGRMYYNIAERFVGTLLDENTIRVGEYCKQVQTTINNGAGYGLQGKAPQIDKNKRDGIINKLALANNYEDVAWMVNEPVINYITSAVNNAINENAQFLENAGVQGFIERTYVSGCCDWCKDVQGRYKYPDVPKNIYKRHLYCRCNVLYTLGRKKTDVWSKKQSDDRESLIAYQNKRNSEQDYIRLQKARARSNAKALKK